MKKTVLKNMFREDVGRRITCDHPACGRVLDFRTAVVMEQPSPHGTIVMCDGHWNADDITHFEANGVTCTTWADIA